MIESGVTFDCAQLVMDAEIARMVKRIVNGIPVNDETLGVDDIVAVGAFSDFLSLESTLKHARDHSQPKLLDRRIREDWARDGSSDLYGRSRAEAVRILREHRPPLLPENVAAEIGRIVEEAEAELGATRA